MRNLEKTFTYDNQNRLTGVWLGPHAMDAAATVAGVFPSEAQTVAYTPFDKISSVSQDGSLLTVNYGIDRQRVTQLFYNGNDTKEKRYFTPLYETVTENGVTKKLHYLTSASGLFAIFVSTSNGGGTMHYTLKDHQGSRTDHRLNNGYGITETFSYDRLDRLGSVMLNSVQTGQTLYDNYGRITGKTADGQTVFTTNSNSYDMNDKPHALKSASVPEGLLPSATLDISYTLFDKVDGITEGNNSLSYTYGYDRQRILMEEYVGNTVRTKCYVGNCEYVSETTGNTTTSRWLTYLTGPTGVYAVVVTQNGIDETHYILKDNLGSWTAIVNGSGVVEQRLSFDAWGNLRNPDTWSGSFTGTPMFDRGFTGHEHLYDFGLINMNGRMYDPVMSSFLSVDQYVQSPGSSQNFNRYAYCLNNPLRYTDPSGELLWEAVVVGAIIGSFSNAAAQVMSGNVNNGCQFWVAAGIGAISGALGGAAGFETGEIVSNWLGQSIGIGAWRGATIGASSSFAGGFTGSSTAAWMQGASFSKGFWAGLKSGGIGAFVGGVFGGLDGGYYAKQSGGDFWMGEGACFDQMNSDLIYGDPVNYSTEDAMSFSDDYFGKQIKGLNELYADGTLPEVSGYKYYLNEDGRVIKYEVLKNGSLKKLGFTNGTTVYLGKSKSNVYLYPKAFVSKEQLYLTMGHEYIHCGFNMNKSLGNPFLEQTQKIQDASCYQWEIQQARVWGYYNYANHLEGLYNAYYKGYLNTNYQPSISVLPIKPW